MNSPDFAASPTPDSHSESSRPDVVVVHTGSANLASVSAALTRIGATPRLTEEADLVASAPIVILPGVGAFGAAMASLRRSGLDDALRERVRLNRPLLAICLGLQLLCESSEESLGISGLGIVPGEVRRFAPPARVPQMGWNRIAPSVNARLLRPGWMYFANSYRLDSIPPEWSGATTEYGDDPPSFASALERGTLLACQFHPELSGRAGLDLISRWVNSALTSGAVAC